MQLMLSKIKMWFFKRKSIKRTKSDALKEKSFFQLAENDNYLINQLIYLN